VSPSPDGIFGTIPAMFPGSETALTHILVVGDPVRSKAWYTDVLGATLYREYASSVVLSFAGAWLLLVEGGGPISDKPGVTLVPPADPDIRDNLFTVRVEDCQATYDLLRARGATFLTGPVTQGAETRCFFRDPDGHLFEISECRSGG
jgi:catechol 2,3-dioxygenase-like lactoylglutathione lyase family enzyme